MISDELQNAIRILVSERLGKYSVTACDFDEGFDHLEEAIIVITLCYAEDAMIEAVNVNDLRDLQRDTRDKLQSMGEFRYPKFTHSFHPDQRFRAA